MTDPVLGNTCKYAKDCTIYQGSEYKEELPHFLFKNVFCMRGYKGWKNCKKHAEFEILNQEKSN